MDVSVITEPVSSDALAPTGGFTPTGFLPVHVLLGLTGQFRRMREVVHSVPGGPRGATDVALIEHPTSPFGQVRAEPRHEVDRLFLRRP